MQSPQINAFAWLQYIADTAYDRDGCHNAKDLGELVDDIRRFALDGLHGEPCPVPYLGKYNAEP